MLLSVPSVNAALLTYNYSGTIISVSDTTNILTGSGITSGSSTFTGSFTYDSKSPATFMTTDFANYLTGDLSLKFDDNINYFGAMAEIQVNNDSFFSDRFSSISQAPSVFETPAGDRANNFQIELIDNTNSVFSSTALPDSLNLSAFTTARVDVRSFYLDGTNYLITGSIDTLTEISSVPIPATIGLFGAGLMGLFGLARRRPR